MPPFDPIPGTLLAGRYLLRRELGSGGFGQVLLADDRELSRPVAIKLLRPDLADREALARFLREARSTAALDHPHIVRVFDHGRTDEGRFFIVYEYVEGTSAAAAARLGAPLEPHRVASLGRGVAEALAAAHRAGILHRDVKPENILLRRDLSPVLADFGIAQLADDPTIRTGTGLILGTPVYLAPEVWGGSPPGPASDQYALGATLYELLFGVPVHPDPAPAAVARRVGQGLGPIFPPVGARCRAPVLEAVLARALAPSPGGRYPDLSAMAEALVAASTPSAPWAPAGAAAGGKGGEVTLVQAGPGSAPGTDRPTRPSPAPPPGTANSLRWIGLLAALAAVGLGIGGGGGPGAAAVGPDPGAGAATPSPVDEAWEVLERSYRAVLAGFPRTAAGAARPVTVLERRREFRSRRDLVGDVRVPQRIARLLGELGSFLRVSAGEPVGAARRAMVGEMVSVYLGTELPALEGIEDELVQERLKRSVREAPPPDPSLELDPRTWGRHWQVVRTAAEQVVRALPRHTRDLEFETAVLAALLRGVLVPGDERATLARLVSAPLVAEDWRGRGLAVEMANRLVSQLARTGPGACELVPGLLRLAAGDFLATRPVGSFERRTEALRGLRLARSLGGGCAPALAEGRTALEPLLGTLEEAARDDPAGTRAALGEAFRFLAVAGPSAPPRDELPGFVVERLRALVDGPDR